MNNNYPSTIGRTPSCNRAEELAAARGPEFLEEFRRARDNLSVEQRIWVARGSLDREEDERWERTTRPYSSDPCAQARAELEVEEQYCARAMKKWSRAESAARQSAQGEQAADACDLDSEDCCK